MTPAYFQRVIMEKASGDIEIKSNILPNENVNIKKNCRICLSQFDRGISLFESNENLNDKTPASLIWKCFRIKILKNDELSNEICNECALNILLSHNFKIQLQQSYKLLQCSTKDINNKKSHSITKIENNVYRIKATNDFEEPDIDIDETSNVYLDLVHNLEINRKVELENESDVLLIVAEKRSTVDSSSVSSGDEVDVPKSMEDASKWLKTIKNSEPPYTCKICNRSYQSKYATFYTHVRTHFVTKIQCSLCPLKYLPGRETYHMRTHSKEKPYECTACNKSFTMKNHLNRHVELRCNIKKDSKCKECQKIFATSKLMHVHRMKEHNICKHEHIKSACQECNRENENKRMCEYCGVKVARYNRHLNTCKAAPIEKRFQLENAKTCDKCGELLFSEYQIKAHKRKHSSGSKCDICGKVFLQNQYLKDHMEIHSPGHYPCDKCGKTFNRKLLLKLHRTTHDAVKKYECGNCGKLFKGRDHLKKHLAVHTENKPYVCHVCDKVFGWKGNLNQHLLIHSKMKYFSCEVCQKTFAVEGNLRIHMSTHNDNAKFNT